jgi:ribonuclease Z
MRFVSSAPRVARAGTVAVAVALAASFAAQSSAQPSPSEAQAKSQAGDMLVTLLGTGSPVPSATRFGNSTLVQAGGLNLVFDAGRGAAIRLAQAGVPVGEVDGVFITHFHSDHVNGLDDLWLTGYIPALGGRPSGQLDVYGPTGVKDLAENLTKAFEGDIATRVADGEVDRTTTKLVPYESARDGIVFDRDGVRVRMFTVDHDPGHAIEPAVGYRVDYGRHSVLISGDTRPTPNVIRWGQGVDVLIHEVADFPDPTLPAIQGVYAHHTNPRQAGEIFARTRPQMAVYSHIVRGAPPRIPNVPLSVIAQRTRETYGGPLTIGEDLTRFVIARDGVAVVPHFAEND